MTTGIPAARKGVSRTIGSRDHPGHRTDADHADALVSDELHQFLVAHGLRVSVQQQNLVLRRRQRLQKEHPQVRHEIAGNPIVRIVE